MKTYKIGEFAKELNLSVKTLQNWDKSGFLKAYRNPSNQRFYTEEQLIGILKQPEEKINYLLALIAI